MMSRLTRPDSETWHETTAKECALALCAHAPRDSEEGFLVTGQTPERVRFNADVQRIIDLCDKSGHLKKYLYGQPDNIPQECRRKRCCGKCARALEEDLAALKDILGGKEG